MSKGEEKISSLLKSAHIAFKREYSFPNLKSYQGILLRFDFAIFIENSLYCLLEYDGEAHFQQINHFHKTQSDFRRAQERDRIKNKYCLLNNIKLIRIPYWEIQNLTINSLFNTESFIVTSKFHNDLLRPPA